MRKELLTSANRLNEDCIFTAKEHFYFADFLSKIHYGLGFGSAFAAGLIVWTISTPLLPTDYLIPTLSLIALVASALVTTYNPGKRMELHQRIGNQFLSIQKKTRKNLDIELRDYGIDYSTLKELLDNLYKERECLLKEHSSVIIPEWVHKKVKKKIESGEAEYGFSHSS